MGMRSLVLFYVASGSTDPRKLHFHSDAFIISSYSSLSIFSMCVCRFVEGLKLRPTNPKTAAVMHQHEVSFESAYA